MSKKVIMSKKEKYELLLQQVESLIEGETNKIGVMANITAAIHDTMQFFWVGFYLVEGNELILGPFQGSVACFRIPCTKGVCGAAWSRRATVVVEDVDKFPGHIACSSLSRSEIVVPVFNQQGEVAAQIYFFFAIFRKKEYLCNPNRGVAQLASASALGAEGRVFESHHPDKKARRTRLAFPSR